MSVSTVISPENFLYIPRFDLSLPDASGLILNDLKVKWILRWRRKDTIEMAGYSKGLIQNLMLLDS